MVIDEEGQSPADALFFPRTQQSLRVLPRLTAGAVQLVWRAAPRELAGTGVLQVVGGLLLALQVIASKFLLTRLLASSHSTDFHSAIPWLIVVAAVFAGSALIAVIRMELQRLLSELVARFSLQRVVDAAAATDLIEFEDPDFHDRLQRATVNASIRPFQMTNGLLSLGSSVLGSLAVSITLATIEPLLLVLAVVAVIPITVVSLGLGRALYRFAVEQTPLDRERNYMQQLLTEKDPAKEIRAFELAPYISDRFATLYEVRLKALRRLMRSRVIRGLGGALIAGLAIGGSLGLLIYFVSDHRISLAGAGAGAAALLLLSAQLQGFSAGIGALYESALFIQDFNTFVDRSPSRGAEGTFTPDSSPFPAVHVDGISFTYPSRDEPSLEQVDLEIEPGQVVALVGENGSGKTTLAKLVAGLYTPQSGTIRWGQRDMSSIATPEIRGRVAVLFQDFVRYFMTAHGNIAMGSWRHAERHEEIRHAARMAGAHDFVSRLPRGYDTLLGPQFLGGSDLSGGQWQRLALARAFFRNANLIILDEPTASLDPKAEAALFAAVRELFAGRSVLLVSHRFASVRLADHIYVLDQGQVIEHGTHDQLMAEAGRYAEMFTLQAAAYGIDTTSRRAPRRPDTTRPQPS